MKIQLTCWTLALALAGCGGSKPAAQTPPAEPPATTAKPTLTQAQCEAQSGHVVGDIGDGAVHRPDYVCPSGKPPVGTIAPEAGAPMAVEGSVCCP